MRLQTFRPRLGRFGATLRWAGALVLGAALVGCGPAAPSSAPPAPSSPIAAPASKASSAKPTSLEGGLLAFSSKGALWVATSSGRRRLGPGTHPVLSPEGDELAYLLPGSGGQATLAVALLGAAGGFFKTGLNTGPGLFAWVPGTDMLVVAPAGRPGQLVRVDARSGAVQPFYKASPGALVRSVLPLGGTPAVVFGLDAPAAGGLTGELFIKDLGPSPARRLVVAPGDGIIPAAASGGHILYWVDPQHSSSLAADGMALYSVGTAGGAPAKLAVTLGYRDWVALGTQKAYLVAGAGRAAWAGKQLVSCSLEAARCTPLLSGLGIVPGSLALSPGEQLAFTARKELGPNPWAPHAPRAISAWMEAAALWTAGAGTPGPQPVPGAPAGAGAPRWMAGGAKIVYLSRGAVYATDVRTGNTQEIARGAAMGPADAPVYYGHADLSPVWDFWPGPSRPSGALSKAPA